MRKDLEMKTQDIGLASSSLAGFSTMLALTLVLGFTRMRSSAA